MAEAAADRARLSRRNKRIAVAAAVVAVVVAVRGGGHLWAGGALRDFQTRHAGEAAAVRSEIAGLRAPAVAGATASDDECFGAYDRAFKDAEKVPLDAASYGLVVKLAARGPQQLASELDAEARRTLGDAIAAATVGLGEATRCSRLDPARVVSVAPSPLPVYRLGAMLVVDGHVHALAGGDDDTLAAAKDYARAVKLGSDVSLVDGTMAATVTEDGCMALAALAASGHASHAALDVAASSLAALRGWLPALDRELRVRTLVLDDIASDALGGVGIPPLSSPTFGALHGAQRTAATAMTLAFTDRTLSALALPELERAFAEAVRVAALPAPTVADEGALTSALMKTRADTSNPVVVVVLPLDVMQKLRQRAAMRAACAMAEVAVRLELEHTSAGAYPAEDRASLPVDPADGVRRLAYVLAKDGAGYRLSSVGVNRIDPRDDLVIER